MNHLIWFFEVIFLSIFVLCEIFYFLCYLLFSFLLLVLIIARGCVVCAKFVYACPNLLDLKS
jgi:hypothetical protein